MNIMKYLLMLLAALLKLWTPVINHLVPVLNQQVVRVRNLSDNPRLDNRYPVLDFIGLVEQHGYIGEEYNVTTDDGYVLRLHRIISDSTKSRSKVYGKPVVYIQHGIGLSSDSWVLIGPQKDLAFLLVDAGYDVWLGNARGNAYSRSHLFKSPNDPDFWEFSYHEIAIYDVKSFIDRILNETGAQNLTYYGYSMGTTLSYVLLSTYPEYNAKITKLYSLAPVAFWEHELKRITRFIDAIFESVKMLVKYFRLNELLPMTALSAYLGDTFCGDDDVFTQPTCAYLYSSIGLDVARLNKSALSSIMAHFPAGMSKYTVYHFNENYQRKTFQAYDYSKSKNLKKYGLVDPPFYDLSKVTVPTEIYYGESDDIVNTKDVLLLADRLPNVIALRAVKHPGFNHFDFLWAIDAKELLYDNLY